MLSISWLRTAAKALLVALVLLPILAIAPVHAEEQPAYLPAEVLVKLGDASDLGAITADFGLGPLPLDQFGTRAIYRLRISSGVDPAEVAAALSADGRVLYAEPNYLEETPEGRKKSPWVVGGYGGDYGNQWAPQALRLDTAHAHTRGAGITVAILDTGIDGDHPALAGVVGPGFDFVDFDADPREEGSPANPGYGHGTHVAGLVALVAPEARIMPLRVLDPDGVGNLWVLAEALLFAVDPDGNPATDDGAQVINLSLGTLRPTSLLAEIVAEVTCANHQHDDDDDDDDDDDGDDRDDDAEDEHGSGRCSRSGGAVVVAAAGNEGSETPHYPAAEGVAGALAVAASTADNQLAPFSSRGAWVQLAAPGEQIISSIPGGGYAVWSGTSMAAPLVAGTAALVRATYPGLSAPEIAATLVDASHPLCSIAIPRVDAAAALGLPTEPAGPCSPAQP